MIHFKTHIDKIDWCIECYVTTDESHVSEIMDKLKALDCSESVLKRACIILNDQIDSGFAYSNTEKRKSLMIINMSSSMDEFVNTYNHEKNHIEMHICETLGIDPYSEVAADLSGHLAQILYNTMLESVQ